MRKTITTTLLIVVLITACKGAPIRAPYHTSSHASSAQFKAVQAHIERLVDDGEVPSMAVAVARDGDIIWEEAFGLADREKNIPATEHTPYPLASISKPLTATGLMILVQRGLIDLDSPIDNYLGAVKLKAQVGEAAEATVRRVASHTAGLPLHAQHFYANEPNQPPAMDETIHRYGNIITAPGECYQYSNLSYGILGYVIAQLTSENTEHKFSYANFMDKEVFDPLGMDNTSVNLGRGIEEGVASIYTPEGLLVPTSTTDTPGASEIYSSAHDLILFAMFHLKNDRPYQKTIISYNSIDEMQHPSPETGPTRDWEHEGSGYGLGWFVGITKDGLQVIYHPGGTLGVSTALALVPEENLAVAVLSNTNSQYPDEILIETICTLLSRNMEEFLPRADTSVDQSQFVLPLELVGSWGGSVHTYEDKVALTLKIEESGKILATLGAQPHATPLQDVSYQDSFPLFMNSGGGLFLRGWLQGELGTADVNRGQPTKLWLELKLRENVLNGSLIAFSQRTFYTGPLSHWVELEKE